MDRREAIKYISVLLGGTLVGAGAMLNGCRTGGTKTGYIFNESDIAFLDEVADTILPETSTPGAKAADVGRFMTVMVNDCYEPEDQKVFHEGMDELNRRVFTKYKKEFMEITPEQRLEILTELDEEQKQHQQSKEPHERSHYFRMMKELTLLGYFTSEIGCTQARRYVETPGRYDGCVPYKKGDRAWA